MTMVETASNVETFEINGRRYRSKKYPVEYALRMESKVGLLMSKGIGQIAGSFGESWGEFDGDKLGDGIETFLRRLNELGGPEFYKQVLAETEIITTGPDGDLRREKVKLAHFEDRLADLKVLCYKVLEHNFKQYFTGAFGRLEGLLEKVKAQAGTAFQEQLADGLKGLSPNPPSDSE